MPSPQDHLRSVCAVAVLFIAPHAALAAVTFDLTGSSELAAGSPFVVSAGGVDLLATGWTTADADAAGAGSAADAPFVSLSPRGLDLTANGIGVSSGDPLDDSSQTDGAGLDEVLRVQFSEPVRLTKLVLTLASVDDEFDFAFGPGLNPASVVDVQVNQTLGDDAITAIGTPLGDATTPVLDFEVAFNPTVFVGTDGAETAPTGQTFEFYLTDANDDYKIAAIEVAVGPEIIVVNNDIPEPAALGLGLGLGLLTMVLSTMRRRRA